MWFYIFLAAVKMAKYRGFSMIKMIVKRLKVLFVLLPSVLAAVTISCGRTAPADLVIVNGKIITVDRHFSIHRAAAVLGDRIVFLGSNKEIKRFIGSKTNVIQLGGKVVLPGLIDAHAHLHSLGEQLSYLDITGTESYKQVVQRVAERVKTVKPGEWIIGGRWDHNDWPGRAFPHHRALSNISPHNPVYLRRIDGNSALVNQKAMEIAGIGKETPDPFGGVIRRDHRGEPTGVLINRAMNLVKNRIPRDTKEQYREKFQKAVGDCLEKGLTCIHEAGVGPDEINMYKGLIDGGQLNIRICAMLGEQEKPPLTGDLVAYFRKHKIEQYGNYFLSVRSIKLFFDGALGSRGAAFFKPYADDPGNLGLLRITPRYITRIARAALKVGMGVNTHCIGIRGNRLCLDAYERALKENPVKDHRFRIEHAQVVRPEDVRKFAGLGVIPAMQPTHCTSDMYFVEDRIGGHRAGGAYAWKWFINAGLVIPCGSDFPVESNNPLSGIYAAITRQDEKGWPNGGWFPQQRMTREEAIKGFTIWAAYAAFQEKLLGSIETGKLADFTVLDRDILTIAPEEILQTNVVYTIVGGKIRYQRQ
jgi:predicted amidohydrolase YtcJ